VVNVDRLRRFGVAMKLGSYSCATQNTCAHLVTRCAEMEENGGRLVYVRCTEGSDRIAKNRAHTSMSLTRMCVT
jgi:hypothetical protein